MSASDTSLNAPPSVSKPAENTAASNVDHDDETKRKIVNRLRRAHGQLAAVIGSVEENAHCREVIQQLSAVSKALDRAGFLVISHALQECMTEPANDSLQKREELEKLFLTLA